MFNFFNKKENKLNYEVPIYHRVKYVYLHRGRKSTLESSNEVIDKYHIIVEFPDDFTYDYENKKELLGKKFKYKIGDGKTPYKDLPYEEGEIPVAFLQ